MPTAPSRGTPVIDPTLRLRAAPAVLAAALALGGCASAPLKELAQARATLAAATQSNDASAELARANDKLALARRWMDARDYGPSRWLVEQAQVDAELALAKAAADDAHRAAALAVANRTAVRRISGREL